MVGIYKLINPQGKIYIGQSINIEKRLLQYQYSSKYSLGRKIYNSIKKYGWKNHTCEIIEEYSTEQLDEKEIFWGEYYSSLGSGGLNLKLGEGRGKCSDETKKLMSESAKMIMTKEHREKLSQAKKGKKRSEKAKQALRVPKKNKINFQNNGKWISNSTSVLQYNLKGKFIREWKIIKDAELTFHPKKKYGNNITNCCRGSQKTAYGYIWKYKK